DRKRKHVSYSLHPTRTLAVRFGQELSAVRRSSDPRLRVVFVTANSPIPSPVSAKLATCRLFSVPRLTTSQVGRQCRPPSDASHVPSAPTLNDRTASQSDCDNICFPQCCSLADFSGCQFIRLRGESCYLSVNRRGRRGAYIGH